VARLLLYPAKITSWGLAWRVSVPDGLTGYRHVTFKHKSKAIIFHRACKRELRKAGRVKAVDFLTSAHKLLDALEGLKTLRDESGPWQNRLRRAAALYKLCCDEQETKVARGYSEPLSRGIELQPALFRAVCRLAGQKGVDLNDLVAGLMWRFVKEESEKQVKEYPNEDRVRLRNVL
jgi:hypothetical protein